MPFRVARAAGICRRAGIGQKKTAALRGWRRRQVCASSAGMAGPGRQNREPEAKAVREGQGDKPFASMISHPGNATAGSKATGQMNPGKCRTPSVMTPIATTPAKSCKSESCEVARTCLICANIVSVS